MQSAAGVQSHDALELLKIRLGSRVVTSGPELERVSRDTSRYAPIGEALAVVFPESTEDVSVALAWANQHRIPVSVRGAGTGLSGGAEIGRASWSERGAEAAAGGRRV